MTLFLIKKTNKTTHFVSYLKKIKGSNIYIIKGEEKNKGRAVED